MLDVALQRQQSGKGGGCGSVTKAIHLRGPTCRPTVSEPMKIICLILREVVKASACSGRQQTSFFEGERYFIITGPCFTDGHTCTNSGSKLQARKHSLITSTNHFDDQATYSEHLITIALPVNRAAKIGDQELCNAEGDQIMR